MLTKSELLDRMELINPDDSRFSDLRRAYIDRDLASIFRIMDELYHHDIDTVRNLTDDLRKLILEDNIWSLYRILLDFKNTQFIHTIKSFHSNGIDWDKDAMSQGQLLSKMWLINELKHLDLDLGTVFLCAGWYGILSVLMFENNLKIDRVRSFDIDPLVSEIADKFNLPWFSDTWKFKSIVEDIHNIDFSGHSWTAWSTKNERMCRPIHDIPDTIINTSCEHIENFNDWYAKIPAGKLVILQSNDYVDIDEHVNTSLDLYNFAVQTPMDEVLFSGELNLTAYNRFMRIGYK